MINSYNEIMDSYLPHRLSSEYEDFWLDLVCTAVKLDPDKWRFMDWVFTRFAGVEPRFIADVCWDIAILSGGQR